MSSFVNQLILDLRDYADNTLCEYIVHFGLADPKCFVCFFLAEYCSIVLMSALSAILFMGGYIMPEIIQNETFINLQSVVLALKTCIFCFIFV